MEFLKSMNWSSIYFNLQLIIAAAAVIAIVYKVFIYLINKVRSIILKIKNQCDTICKIQTMIPKIYEELTPNHGTSIKDKIDKIDKKVEENIKVTNLICHRQKWILDNREEPIFETDEKGNCTWVNEKYCQLVKHNMTYMLGHGWKNVVHENDRERVVQEWESAIQDKRGSTCSYQMVDSDGNIYHVVATATINDVYGYIGSIKILNKN